MITLELGQVCVGRKKFVCRRIPMNMMNRKLHWAVKKLWTDSWKHEVEAQIMLQRRKLPKLPLPYAKITIVLKMIHLMDYDGAYTAVKPLLDALKDKGGAGVIVDDSPKYIDLLVKQEKVFHRAEEGVTMLIE